MKKLSSKQEYIRLRKPEKGITIRPFHEAVEDFFGQQLLDNIKPIVNKLFKSKNK